MQCNYLWSNNYRLLYRQVSFCILRLHNAASFATGKIGKMHYKSLAAHNAACNWIFHRFQDCENKHPYRRFLGYCEQIQKEMNQCIKEQREIRRNENARHRHGVLERLETTEKRNN